MSFCPHLVNLPLPLRRIRRLGPAKIIISEDDDDDDDDRLIELCFPPPCSTRNLSSDVGGDGAAAWTTLSSSMGLPLGKVFSMRPQGASKKPLPLFFRACI